MKKTKDPCKKYGIAITNYVLGEDLRMPPEELYTHLKSCPKCLDELKDWQDVYATMRTEAYHQTPEAKQKYQELLAKIRALPTLSAEQAGVSADRPIDGAWVVGSAAGKIYQVLKGNGKTSYPVIRDKTGLVDFPFYESMGWLLREKKVLLSEGKQTIYAALTETERPRADRPIDGEWVVGSAAGQIYQVLKANGKTPYPVIREKSGLVSFPFYEAMGWLIGEKKVHLSQDATMIYAALTPLESNPKMDKR